MASTGTEGARALPPTRWTLVARAAHGDTQGRLGALDELLRIYRPVLVRHLTVGMGMERATAEDLVQGFLADRVLVLSASPGRIKKEFKIDVPRPRTVNDVRLFSMVNSIRKELRMEIEQAMSSEVDSE